MFCICDGGEVTLIVPVHLVLHWQWNFVWKLGFLEVSERKQPVFMKYVSVCIMFEGLWTCLG